MEERSGSEDSPGMGDETLDRVLKAAFSTPREKSESALEAIGRLAGESPSVLLRDPPDEASPILRAPPREGPEAVADDPRYQILGEIGRGGVGIVYKARDRDLGRSVALKVLRAEFSERPDVVRRFVEEAQVGGQLQHPGIVPLYGLALQPDGRPCFAMKYVKGRTLAARLAARLDPAEDLATFLAIFERVARTVAYAHSRGVIHRDLKPANVMTGAFGEVQVMDWGFAKVLGRDEAVADPEPERTVVATLRSGGDGSESVAGSVMGTPSYMPPEQALGRVADLDERADVFSLGAILTEILTGLPPYIGEAKNLLVMAAQARQEETHLRLDACRANPALISLARRSIAPCASDRPATAEAVANEVRSVLTAAAERARQAELRAAQEQARREQERARLAAECLATARHRADEAEQRSEALRQKRELDAAARKLVSERRKRVATLTAAGALLLALVAGTWGYLRSRAEEAARAREIEERVSRSLQAAAAAAGREDWGPAVAAARAAVDLARDADDTTRDRAQARLAEVGAGQATAAAVAAQAEKDRRMLERLEAADLILFGGGTTDPHERQTCLSRPSADPKARCAAFEAAFREYGIDVVALDPSLAADRIRCSAIRERLVGVLFAWAYDLSFDRALNHERRRRLVAVLEKAASDPLHVGIFEAVIARDESRLRPLAEEALSRGAPTRVLNLASIGFRDAWDGPPPIVHALQERVARQALGTVFGHMNRASTLERQGRRLGEAVGHVRALVALRPRADPVWDYLVRLLYRTDDWEHAESAARRGMELAPDQPGPLVLLASILDLKGDLKEADQRRSEAARRWPEWADTKLSITNQLEREGKPERAAEVLASIPDEDPLAATARTYQGHLLLASRRTEDALGCLRRAAELSPGPQACWDLAQHLTQAGRHDEAIKYLRKGLEYAPEHGQLHLDLAKNLIVKGELEEAERELDRGIEGDRTDRLHPLAWEVRRELALARCDYREALRCQRQRLRRRPYPLEFIQLGFLRSAIGDHRRALRAFKEGISFLPDPRAISEFHGEALLALGRYEEAEKACRAASGNPVRRDFDLGILCLEEGRRAEARDYANRAVAQSGPWLYPWLLEMQVRLEEGNLVGACEAGRRILPVRAPIPPPYWALRSAFLRQMALLESGLEFQGRLDDIRAGRVRPESPSQAAVCALLCHFAGEHPDALRFFREAFEEEAEILLVRGCAIHAAESALAGGDGDGRRRALETLRLALSGFRGRSSSEDQIARIELRDFLWTIRRWPGLAPVRDRIDELPEAERGPCRDFWEKVDETLETSLAAEQEE